MKHFFALPALLRPAVLLATASQHSFSVTDDLLAFPQYEVIFPPEDYILDTVAEERLKSNINHSRSVSHKRDEEPSQQVDQYRPPSSTGDLHDDGTESNGDTTEQKVIYEYMLLEDQRYLCSIPQIAKPPPPDAESQANATLAKAEEQKELIRATDHGWEILEELSGQCVYFYGGWWSYRFCYGKGVKQFHQLPQTRGMPAFPPVEDPTVPGFELGVYKGQSSPEKIVDDDETEVEETGLDIGTRSKKPKVGSGGLVQRGDKKYLVQRLDGGTKCDLTGKPRKIEVQFHCNPDGGDRITTIKETSTCTYLMVVQTNRLCKDVAFHPPIKDAPNAVSCARVLTEEEVPGYEKDLAAHLREEKQAQMWAATAQAAEELGINDEAYTVPQQPVVIGDILLGGRKLIPEGHKLEKSAIVGGGKETFVETIASSSGPAISDADMKRLGLGNKEAFNKLREELEKMAQGQEWKVDIFDTPRGREFRGIIGDKEDDNAADPEGENEKANADKKTTGQKGAKKKEKTEKTGDKAEGKKEKQVKQSTNLKPKKVHNEKEKKQETNEDLLEGSEEEFFHHDEL